MSSGSIFCFVVETRDLPLIKRDVCSFFQETEDVLNQGERNYHETAELVKTISENEILVDKKAKDAENDMKNSSVRYNKLLEDVQNKKNK